MPAQPEPIDRAEVTKLANAVEEALAGEMQTTARSEDPDVPSFADGVRIGTAPPMAQQGRPPMSQRAVDLNTTILSSSVVIGMLGVAGTGVLWASSQANPTVIAWMCGCAVGVPAAFAVPVLALKALMKSAKQVVEAAPPTIHQYYNGNVTQDQREIHASAKGVWVRTKNEIS